MRDTGGKEAPRMARAKPKLSPHELRKLAVVAETDERTIERAYLGQGTARALARARAVRALVAGGFLTSEEAGL